MFSFSQIFAQAFPLPQTTIYKNILITDLWVSRCDKNGREVDVQGGWKTLKRSVRGSKGHAGCRFYWSWEYGVNFSKGILRHFSKLWLKWNWTPAPCGFFNRYVKPCDVTVYVCLSNEMPPVMFPFCSFPHDMTCTSWINMQVELSMRFRPRALGMRRQL